MAREPRYPFEPRSTAHLLPGQFWSVPLKRGHFGCGRVIQRVHRGDTVDPRLFLAGLMDWIGSRPPTASELASRRVIAQGQVHVRCVRETGKLILGRRALELDDIEPATFLDAACPTSLLRGTIPIRAARRGDRDAYPVLETWGGMSRRLLIIEAAALSV